jgi:hypothetical protein
LLEAAEDVVQTADEDEEGEDDVPGEEGAVHLLADLERRGGEEDDESEGGDDAPDLIGERMSVLLLRLGRS